MPTRGGGEFYAKALIRSLEDRICSLERQLEQKQEIIVKLLENQRPTQDSHQTAPHPDHSNNKCPMIIAEKIKEKKKGPTAKTENSTEENTVSCERKLNTKAKNKITNSNESENTQNTRRKITII